MSPWPGSVCNDANLSLPQGLSHPKEEQLKFAAAYFLEEGDPEFRPSPGLKSLPSTSCIQALFLLVSIPWWDKHVSNQLSDVAAWRAPCSSLQPGIPVRFPSGDMGSAAKGLYGIKHSTSTESSQTQNVLLERPSCIYNRFASAQAATGRG